MDLPHLALLLIAGFGAGYATPLPEALSFPALLATGLPPVAATVTNSVSGWPGYFGGAAALRRRRLHPNAFRAVVIIFGVGAGATMLLS
ncbi:hypothetical protein [Nocardia vinacea]|uniref:hypothetical protein n=1 Tax=Nocardia vinacea TaxID=96468 RepID=UPI002E11D0BF